MNKQSKLVFAILMILLIPSFALAKKSTPQITKITSNSAQQNSPQIYGDNIVWADWRSADGIDIWIYNLKTKQEQPLITRVGNQFPTDINDKYVLYSEYIDSTSGYDTRLYNLIDKTDILIAGGSGDQMSGTIKNDTITYILGYGYGDLYTYNLETKIIQLIASNIAIPRMTKSKIVWYIPGYQVKGYKIRSNAYFDVDSNVGSASPDIYGYNIVWSNDGIYLKNLRLGSIIKISSEGSWPKISRDYVTWVQDDGIGAHNIYRYTIATKQTMQISNDGPQQPSPTIPSIWENRIVWMSWVTGNGDIYLAQ